MPLADLNNYIVGSAPVPRRRCELFRERLIGPVGEDLAPGEEFNEKVSCHSSEHEVLLGLLNRFLGCLPTRFGGVIQFLLTRFEPLVGVGFGVKHDVIGYFRRVLVHLAWKGARGQMNRRHGCVWGS